MNRRSFILGGLASLCLTPFSSESAFSILSSDLSRTDNKLTEIDDGLQIGFFQLPKSLVGDSRLTVIKVNPQFYDFKLLMNSQYGGFMSAEMWAREYDLTCVMNAGMFLPGGKNCGYAKNGSHINNSRIAKGYNSFLVFNPLEKGLPKVDILNREEMNFERVKNQYSGIVQNLRTIKNGKNVWAPSKRRWSEASIGIDSQGNLLFMHSRAPYSVHDFNQFVLSLPLNVKNAMHCEGGPEASLSVYHPNYHLNLCGSYETGFYSSDSNSSQWPIPNVFSAVRRK